jgi:hypothetical protein
MCLAIPRGHSARRSRRRFSVASRAAARRQCFGETSGRLFSDRKNRNDEHRPLPSGNRGADHALEDRPEKIYDDLAEAVRCLVQLRGELIARLREGAPSDRLERCNAILSMVVGGAYPLTGVRRDRVQKARGELDSLFNTR